MFGLFKKKEDVQAAEQEQSAQFKKFAADFLPEELSILAVTGANGFSGGRMHGEELWSLSTELTAWMEEDTPDIHQGEFGLCALGDEKLMGFLRRRVPPDFIIKFKARLSADGKHLLLLDLPEPGFDLDLKAILEEQKKPVTYRDEGLGIFTLNRQVDWLQIEKNWLGTPISLVFDRNEDWAACVEHIRVLLVEAEIWDRRVRVFAAGELLDLANDWSQDMDEDGEAVEITQEQFMERMELESVEIRADGGFLFWFRDGDLFCGHSIRVSGDLENGPDEASMEG